MKLSYNLTLEQSQKLIMTPELRQAIQLLQYNSLELNDFINKEMQENPLLEMDSSNIELENVVKVDKEQEIDWKEYLDKYDDYSYRPKVDKNQTESNLESFTSYDLSLREHLVGQLALVKLNPEQFRIGEYLIQSLNDNGYLNISLEDIALQLNVSPEDLTNVLDIIQTFDPLGVGARSLVECLLIQVKGQNINDKLINIIIEEHLNELGHNRLSKIAKEENVDLLNVQKACDFIRTLEPKPGRSFQGNYEDVKYITADASIQFTDGEYIVLINDVTGPRLNINNFYKNMIKEDGDKETTEYLSNKLNSAMWIIKSIEQRRQTIYKVIQSILKFQLEFFKEGDKKLIPLTLKDVAEDIEMHESTISRATNGKYVQTPRGLFELKYFFSSGLSSSEGSNVSSTSVKSIIKDIIEGEDNKKPFSDQKIADILKVKGHSISRRTISKYRDELGILSSTMRRRY